MTAKIDMEALRKEVVAAEAIAYKAWWEARNAHHAVLECEEALKAAKIRASHALTAAKEAMAVVTLRNEAARDR